MRWKNEGERETERERKEKWRKQEKRQKKVDTNKVSSIAFERRYEPSCEIANPVIVP